MSTVERGVLLLFLCLVYELAFSGLTPTLVPVGTVLVTRSVLWRVVTTGRTCILVFESPFLGFDESCGVDWFKNGIDDAPGYFWKR